MDIVEQLLRDEGWRNKMYLDTRGIPTIGVGRNLRDVGLSDDEVKMLLQNDIAKVQNQLSPYSWYQKLSPARQGAMQNMCFNLGIDGLLHFVHMIAAMDKEDWAGAIAAMQDSAWSSQVGARASRLEQQILTDQWV